MLTELGKLVVGAGFGKDQEVDSDHGEAELSQGLPGKGAD